MKHWLELLPEAGRQAERLAEQQKRTIREIASLKMQIADLEHIYKDEEKNILEIVSTDWTISEIKTAMREAEALNTK